VPVILELPSKTAALPGALARCRDPDDLHFLELAYRGRADMLVSRDKAVLALKRRASTVGLAIVDVPQMLARLGITHGLIRDLRESREQS
jgi:predicted nucleic acid-binding protein